MRISPRFHLVLFIAALSLPALATTAVSPLFAPYRAIQVALAGDQLGPAQSSAKALVSAAANWLEQSPQDDGQRAEVTVLGKAAEQIAADGTLEAQREHFVGASNAVIALIRADRALQPQWQLFFCPMVRQYWVQPKGEKINNPYMGLAMPKCGSKVNW